MQTPKQIGNYTLVRPLGRGGMGEVWLARRDGIEKPFVLKLLLPQLAAHPDYRRRFLREAKILASLRHGRIVPVLDYGEAEGWSYLVMDFIDGVDLKTYCAALAAAGIRLSYAAIAHILAEVLEALRHAHTRTVAGQTRTVVHRDVKPSNVLVSSEGEVFLTDFGIAMYDNEFSVEPLGTLAYIAPEQARGHHMPEPQSDIYGVGGLAHFLITGAPPRRVRHAYELEQILDQPPPPTGVADVPAVLERLRASALEPALERRLARAEDALAMIEDWAGYRRSTTTLAEYYRQFFGPRHSGMTDLATMATPPVEIGEQERTVPTGGPQGHSPSAESRPAEVWRPWWPTPNEAHLVGIPEEYRAQPEGQVDDDAPRIRRRPRREPSPPEPAVPCVDKTEPMHPTGMRLDSHEDLGGPSAQQPSDEGSR